LGIGSRASAGEPEMITAKDKANAQKSPFSLMNVSS
jgi:hypothetical protein